MDRVNERRGGGEVDGIYTRALGVGVRFFYGFSGFWHLGLSSRSRWVGLKESMSLSKCDHQIQILAFLPLFCIQTHFLAYIPTFLPQVHFFRENS